MIEPHSIVHELAEARAERDEWQSQRNNLAASLRATGVPSQVVADYTPVSERRIRQYSATGTAEHDAPYVEDFTRVWHKWKNADKRVQKLVHRRNRKAKRALADGASQSYVQERFGVLQNNIASWLMKQED